MELNKHICNQFVEKDNAFAQITLDDDYIVRDNKPDVVRVIYTKGHITLEDAKIGNQVVWITGKLHFNTLYLSDDESRRLESVSGEVPFQEKLIMDDVTEKDEISIEAKIEDLSVGIINSRKLVVRGVLNLSGRALEEQQSEITCMISDGDGYEQKTQEINMLCLVDAKKDMIRIQKELVLPGSKSNIGQIVFYHVDFFNEEIRQKNEGLQIQMDARVWVLYRSESSEEYECFETTVPVTGSIESDYLTGDEIFWSRVEPLEVLAEPRADYDGESRMLGLEVSLSVEAEFYREESCRMLVDAYSLQNELTLEKEPAKVSHFLMKNLSKVRILEQEHLEPNQEKILQICGSSGTVSVDRMKRMENGMLLEGLLQVHILYNTTADSMPIAHSQTQIPFEQLIEMNGFSEDTMVRMEAKLEQLQVNLLDNTEYEVKAVIQVGLFAREPMEFSNIVNMIETPIDMELLKKQPGMVGCVRKAGEDIWDIAKKYHASTENIIELDDKVLIVKQVR
uniref:DUF3794 domain-containing protein n=1 Tax=Agathobacter sp. TaxID=2021311 RepID=UPI0040565D72